MDSYQALYTELLESYLRQDEPLKIPDTIKKTIRLNLANIIKSSLPELTSKEEKIPALAERLELTIVPDDPDRAKLNEAIITACKQTESLRNFIKKENKARFDALFDEHLIQFAPDPEHPKAAGAYGWGFDVTCGNIDYRIVVYAPEKFDGTNLKTESTPSAVDGNTPLTSFVENEHGVKRPQVVTRGDKYEHGPAHVHVIDKKNGRETKFELIEDFEDKGPFVKKQQSDNPFIEPLQPAQIREIIPIIQDHVPDFTKLWRKFYKNTPLASEITRVSEIFPDFIARTQLDTDDRGRQLWVVKLRHIDNPSNRMTIPLADYARLPKGASRPRTSFELEEVESYDRKFVESITPLLSPKRTENLPSDVEADILKNALQLFNSGYTKQHPVYHARDLDLVVDMNDETSKGHNEAIIEACKQSQAMRKLVKLRNTESYQEVYLDLLNEYLRPEKPVKLPEAVEKEIRMNLAGIIKNTMPEMTTKEEKLQSLADRLNLTIVADDPAHAKLNDAIIAACRQSESLRRVIKKDNKARFDALFDELLIEMLSKDHAHTIHHDIQVEVKKNAAALLNKEHYATEIKNRVTHDPVTTFDLTLYPDEPIREEHNDIVIEACKLSSALHKFLERRKTVHPKRTEDTPAGSHEEPDISLDDSEDETPVRRAFVAAPKKKKTPAEISPPKEDPHKIDPEQLEKLNILDRITYLKSLSPLQRERLGIKFPSDERAQILACVKNAEICFIKPFVSAEDNLPEFRQPYFTITKKFEKTEDVPTSNGIKAKTPAIAPKSSRFGKSDGRLQKIAAPDSIQADNSTSDNKTDSPPKEKICQIKDKLPEVLRTVFKEQLGLPDELLDKITIHESAEHYKVGIPTFPSDNPAKTEGNPAAISKRTAEHIARKLSGLLGTRVNAKPPLAPPEASQPYLFLPRDFAQVAGIPSSNIPDFARHILQTSLGLRDSQLQSINIQTKGRYYRIKIPEITTEYEKGTGDPYFKKGSEVEKITQSRAELAIALSEELGIRLKNSEATPVFEKDFAFIKPLAPLVNAPPPANGEQKKEPPAPDLSKLNPLEEISYVNSLPEAQRLAETHGPIEYRVARLCHFMVHDLTPLQKEWACYVINNELHEQLTIPFTATSLGKNPNILAEAIKAKYPDSPTTMTGALKMAVQLKPHTPHRDAMEEFLHRIQRPQSGLPDHNPLKNYQSTLRNSASLDVLKRGVIFYSKDSVKAPPPETEKKTEKKAAKPKLKFPTNETIKPEDKIEPFLYFSLPEFERSLHNHNNEPIETRATEIVRDILAFTLGLHEDQIGAIRVERASNGSDSTLLKVKLPSISYTYDAVDGAPDPNDEHIITPRPIPPKPPKPAITDESEAVAEEAKAPPVKRETVTETLTPTQVAQLLSNADSLGVPIENTPTTAVVDSKVRFRAKPEPFAPVIAPEKHLFDTEKRGFVDRFAAFSSLPEKQRKKFLSNTPLMREIRKANIWFVRHGEETVPCLYIAQDIKQTLRLQDDTEVEKSLQDVFRTTFGLKFHQLSAIKLEKTGSLYKIKLRPITYEHEQADGSVTLETLSAFQVAKALEETAGVKNIGSSTRGNHESNVRLVYSSENNGNGAAANSKDEPKPSHGKRFIDMIRQRFTPKEHKTFPAPPMRALLLNREDNGNIQFIGEPRNFDLQLAEFHNYLTSHSLTQDQQTQVFKSIDATLGTTFTENPPDLETLKKAITEHPVHSCKESADHLRLAHLLGIIKKHNGFSADNPFKNYAPKEYYPPVPFLFVPKQLLNKYAPDEDNSKMETVLRDMMQVSMDLSDREREAIVFEKPLATETSNGNAVKIRLPSVGYGYHEAAAIENEGPHLVTKTFTPAEVANALSIEFDIALNTPEGSGATHAKRIVANGKGPHTVRK